MATEKRSKRMQPAWLVPLLLSILVAAVPAVAADFDGDGKNDVAVFRPTDGTWYIINSSDGSITSTPWGTSGDVPAWGDYDGDGKSDIAVWRPSDGTWYILRSSGGTTVMAWGTSGDSVVRQDYDGDGKTDIAVFRPSDGNWYVIRSSDGGIATTHWGTSGDRPVIGDYDGDGKTDIAVFRPSDGNWYINRSSDGGMTVVNWGISTDYTVQADYDGDGKTDIAVWRPSDGNWYIIRSSDGGITTTHWGTNGDKTVPGDYDGDGKADPAVWRPSDGNWYILRSSDGGVATVNWGSNALDDNPQRGTSRGAGDVAAIAARMNELQQLFNDNNANTTTLDPFFHPSFLDGGADKATTIAMWTSGGEGPQPGGSITGVKIEDVLSASPKTYLISFRYAAPDGRQDRGTLVVRKESTTWQMYGDQRIMHLEAGARTVRQIQPGGAVSTISGLTFRGEDLGAAAAVQSIVITGPGIPNNIVLNREPQGSEFNYYQSYSIFAMTDNQVATIPDGASYTFKLYSGGSGTGSLLYTYTLKLPKRPYLSSEATASLFPAITSPTSHTMAAANPGGVLTATYTLPAGFEPYFAWMFFTDWGFNWWNANDWGRPSSYTFDSTGLWFTPVDGELTIFALDPATWRETGTAWHFQQ